MADDERGQDRTTRRGKTGQDWTRRSLGLDSDRLPSRIVHSSHASCAFARPSSCDGGVKLGASSKLLRAPSPQHDPRRDEEGTYVSQTLSAPSKRYHSVRHAQHATAVESRTEKSSRAAVGLLMRSSTPSSASLTASGTARYSSPLASGMTVEKRGSGMGQCLGNLYFCVATFRRSPSLAGPELRQSASLPSPQITF